MYVLGNIMETETTRFLDGVNDKTENEEEERAEADNWRRKKERKNDRKKNTCER